MRWSSRWPHRRIGPRPHHGPTATRPPLKGDQLSSYISIDADGSVVAYYGKIDGGQGLGTAIAQMVAEEIDVAYERVRVVMGDSALTLDMGGASAAIGVSHGGTMLRRTAAETRRLLVEMASEKLGVPAGQLAVTDGVMHGARQDQARDLRRTGRRALSRPTP